LACIAFSIALDGSNDINRTIVKNLGRAIMKTISVKLEGNDVFCIDDADTYLCYKDLFLLDKQRLNAEYYSIQTDDRNKNFPLDFQMLSDHGPLHQGLTAMLSF